MADEELELLRLRAKAKLKLQQMQQSSGRRVSPSTPTSTESMISRAQTGQGAEFIPDDPSQPTVRGPEKARGTESSVEKVTSYLPAAGSIVGGIAGGTAAGAASMGVGAPAGAAIGSVYGGTVGGVIESLINQAFSGENPSVDEAVKTIGGGIAEGAVGAVGGYVLGPTLSVAGKSAKWLGRQLVGAASKAVNVIGYATAPKAAVVGISKQAAALIADRASSMSPRGLRKVLQKEIEPALKHTGKMLASMYDDVTKNVPTESMPSVAQLKAAVRKHIIDNSKVTSDKFFKAVDREIEDQFGESFARRMGTGPDGKLSMKQIWGKAKELSKNYSKYTGNTATPKEKTIGGIHKAMDLAVREEMEKLVNLVGDDVVQNGVKLKDAIKDANINYAKLSETVRIIKPKLRTLTQADKVAIGRDVAPKALSLGKDVIGDSAYKKLTRAAGTGLAALAKAHVDLLQSDENYADIVLNMEDDEDSNKSPVKAELKSL